MERPAWAVGGYPTLAFAPGRQDVPEPAGALVLAVAVVGAVVMRGRRE